MIFYRARFHLGVHDRLCNSQTNMLNNTPSRGRFKNSLSFNSHLGFQAWIILCYPEIYLKIPECRHIYDNHHGFIAGNLKMTRYPRSNTQDTLLGIKSGTYLTAPGKICGTKEVSSNRKTFGCMTIRLLVFGEHVLPWKN